MEKLKIHFSCNEKVIKIRNSSCLDNENIE